jgi:hypothetical protein
MRNLDNGIAASDWPRVLSRAEQARALELIGAPLVRYGYETEESIAQLRRQTAETLASTSHTTATTSARPARTHGYQKRDHEIVDYEIFVLPGTKRQLRGPTPKTFAMDEYFTCVGAGQTFGCLTAQPFATLLADRLDLPALNLGYAGAGPRFFLGHQSVLTYINQARFAIVQVMSGRSEDNALFDSQGLEQLTRRSDGEQIDAEEAYRDLLENESAETVTAIVEETRANWVRSYSMLLGAIQVPTILFWFSERPADYEESYTDVLGLFGKFPQLVNRSMLEQVRDLSDEYVECISARGFPQPLVSRFTGEPVSVDFAGNRRDFNAYYPSPEMHEDAADALLEACRRYAALPR